jgi:hypothetical protein
LADLDLIDGSIPMSLWRAGDIVTRDGTDEHVIVEMVGNDPTDCVLVRCVKEPSEPWTKVGDKENNLLRRYSWLRAGRHSLDPPPQG